MRHVWQLRVLVVVGLVMPRGPRLAGIFGVVFREVTFRGVRANIWGSGFRLGG